MFTKFGRILFQFRAWIAAPFFVFLVLLSRSTVYPIAAYALIVSGCAIRVWAAGYIGLKARTTTFASRVRIISGPYRYLKHPLYLGNLLLVLGVTVLFNPPLPYAFILTFLFVVVYGTIAASEQAYIRALPKKAVNFHAKNCVGEISTIVVLVVVVLINRFVSGVAVSLFRGR